MRFTKGSHGVGFGKSPYESVAECSLGEDGRRGELRSQYRL